MRIIGGQHRGRAIQAPRGKATRPTSDRVREAVFSAVLARLDRLDGLEVLDLYAGSGALGLEALSRGAEHATFVDQAPECLRIIRRNAEQLGLTARCTVLGTSAEAALEQLWRQGARFALVLADPPYAVDGALVLASIAAAQVLSPQGLLVLEHGAGQPSVPALAGLELTACKRYGDTRVSFFQRLAICGQSPTDPVPEQ